MIQYQSRKYNISEWRSLSWAVANDKNVRCTLWEIEMKGVQRPMIVNGADNRIIYLDGHGWDEYENVRQCRIRVFQGSVTLGNGAECGL